MSTDANARPVPVPFGALEGWQDDDHAEAWRAYHLSAVYAAAHEPKTPRLGIDGAALARIARIAAAMPAEIGREEARAFFETHFQPVRVVAEPERGFFTGFYEPEVAASRLPGDGFEVPSTRRRRNWSKSTSTIRRPGSSRACASPARRPTASSRSSTGARSSAARSPGAAWKLAFLADRVDALFVHIQGAARLRLADGEWLRVTYAAKSGHAYTSVGKVLLDRQALPKGGVSMQSIRAWLADHPDQASEVIWQNRSYIFFREAAVQDPALGPIAAAKVPLTAGRSLAVDRTLHTFHAPVWIDTVLPPPRAAALSVA
ncbi:MAG: MltA domain-containing protein [Candidatus Kaistia colombiensis]|nr:MAG: MltA domain-containing protein [Kaistia sp.]